jgi:hypothetical protein
MTTRARAEQSSLADAAAVLDQNHVSSAPVYDGINSVRGGVEPARELAEH